MKYTILVVDDEKNIVETIKAYLEKENFNVLTAYNGKDALFVYENNSVDLIVLDLMLPIISGEEICNQIRKKSNVPIIMLSAKISENNKVNGFEIGADDYVTKPFGIKELIARIKSHLKKSNLDHKISINNELLVDFNTYEVFKNSEKINLTPNEFKILAHLIKNPNKTFTRGELIDLVFDDAHDIYERTIDSHIKNIRKKIEDKTKYIITVRSFGYRLNSGGKDEIKK